MTEWLGVQIVIVMTGGTIAKTYNEKDGSLKNERSVVETLVETLRLPDYSIVYLPLMQKDSLEMTSEDRARIVESVKALSGEYDAVIVVHGTDTLSDTGERLFESLSPAAVPIILTGAMKPYELRDSDAAQNVTEALLACRLVDPGVYVAMHGRVLAFPGVVKDRAAMTFAYARDPT